MSERAPTGGDPDQHPEFGPSGYLPQKAAKRARKIVLRAPLGAQWIVGALVAGVLVLVAGIIYLQGRDAPPPAPWVALAPIEQLTASQHDQTLDALIVTTGGRVRAFSGAQDVRYCADSNRLEAADGRVWSLTGRGLDGTPSLDEHPTLLSSDILYVDPTRISAGPPSSDEPTERGCS